MKAIIYKLCEQGKIYFSMMFWCTFKLKKFFYGGFLYFKKKGLLCLKKKEKT